MEESGVGKCWGFRLVDEKGEVVEESDVISLCEAGDRWVLVWWEGGEQIWYGVKPESAVLAYERFRREGKRRSVEERRRKCAKLQVELESAKREGDSKKVERAEREYWHCLKRLEEEEEELAALDRLVEGLKKGSVKVELQL